jgi:hypothetical protein
MNGRGVGAARRGLREIGEGDAGVFQGADVFIRHNHPMIWKSERFSGNLQDNPEALLVGFVVGELNQVQGRHGTSCLLKP